jgi:hypothetical protein
MKFTGTVLRLDSPTPSGRIYPKSVMEAAIKKFQEDIEQKKCVGYANNDTSMPSHLVTKLGVEGSDVHVDIKTLDTDQGRKMSEIISNNQGGFKMRCAVKMEGVMVTQCQLLSIDFVI